MRRSAALAIVAALFLSGCAGAPNDASVQDDDQGGRRGDVVIQADLPEWRLGQTWRYVMDVPGLPAQTFRMSVAEEHGDLWVVATDDRDQALHHALFSLSPFLGRNGKETLSPYQGGEPVRMYDFPLTDGKNWSAEFFGESMDFQARFVGDIPLQPEVGLGDFAEGFRITAQGGSGTRVLFDFVEAAQWFTAFEVLDPDGGRLIRFDLVGLEGDRKGAYHFYRGEDLLVEHYSSRLEEALVQEVEIPAPEKFDPPDGLAVAVTYVGLPGAAPPLANMSIKAGPDEGLPETLYTTQLSGPGHWFDWADLDMDPSCLQDDPCSSSFTLELRLVGTVEVEVRVVAYQVFAQGVL